MIETRHSLVSERLSEMKQSNHFEINHFNLPQNIKCEKSFNSPKHTIKRKAHTESVLKCENSVSAKKHCGFLREVTNYNYCNSTKHSAINSLESKTGHANVTKARSNSLKSNHEVSDIDKSRGEEETVEYVCDRDSRDLVRDKVLRKGGTIDDVDVFNQQFNARNKVEINESEKGNENRGYFVSDSYKLYSDVNIRRVRIINNEFDLINYCRVSRTNPMKQWT